jgi:hypothetical protein
MNIHRVEIFDTQSKWPQPADPTVEVRESEVSDQRSSKATFRKFIAEAPQLEFTAKKTPSEKCKSNPLLQKDVLLNIDPRVVIYKGVLPECIEEDGFLVSIPRKRRLFRWGR